MPEKEIFLCLIDWLLKNFPELYDSYKDSQDKKDTARKLLLFRIQKDPNHIYCLSESLLRKLGIEVIANPDLPVKILKLIKAVKGRLGMAFLLRTSCG